MNHRSTYRWLACSLAVTMASVFATDANAQQRITSLTQRFGATVRNYAPRIAPNLGSRINSLGNNSRTLLPRLVNPAQSTSRAVTSVRQTNVLRSTPSVRYLVRPKATTPYRAATNYSATRPTYRAETVAPVNYAAAPSTSSQTLQPGMMLPDGSRVVSVGAIASEPASVPQVFQASLAPTVAPEPNAAEANTDQPATADEPQILEPAKESLELEPLPSEPTAEPLPEAEGLPAPLPEPEAEVDPLELPDPDAPLDL